MVKIIAFYLPQFHQIIENDNWWGVGFTEWTNVKKATPLFKNHVQPRIPSDFLGYYDLTDPIVREKQAKIAQEHGVYGFCYWHYWFGNHKRLLEKPFLDVLSSGKPNFPFCLGWANESWESKVWGSEFMNKTLIKQEYPGQLDNYNHFHELLPAFKDKRYIRIDGKVLFYIYKPQKFIEIKKFIIQWNDLAKKNGFEFYFIANTNSFNQYDNLIELGFNAITVNPIARIFEANRVQNFFSIIRKRKNYIFNNHMCYIVNYRKAIRKILNKKEDILENVIPSIVPNWDHSPRSGKNASIIINSTPELFSKSVVDTINLTKGKKNQLIFLKSWNEWGEGNFIEPDIKNGTRYLEALKNSLDSLKIL
jgi:lipopolysaccharide biosynthesis protein